MRSALSLFAAASLTAGSLAFFGYEQSVLAADPNVSLGTGSPISLTTGAPAACALPAGVTRSDNIDQAGIRTTLAKAASAALQPGGLPQLQICLTSADRARLKDLGLAKNQQLEDKLAQFRKDFQAKYNQEFSPNAEMVFNTTTFINFQIVQGECTNPTLLSNWPVEATSKSGSAPGSSTAAPGQHSDAGGPGNPSTTLIPSSSDASKPGDTGATATPGRHADAGGPGNPPTGLVPGSADGSTTSGTGVGATPARHADAGGPGNPPTGLVPGSADGSNNKISTPSGKTIERGMNVASSPSLPTPPPRHPSSTSR